MDQEVFSANNVTLTALLVAILAGTQGVSFLLKNHRSKLNISFAALCGATILANVGLAFATLNQSRGWHVIHLLGSVLSGPAAVYFFLELLGRPQPRGASLRPLLIPVGLGLCVLILTSFNPALNAADVLPISLSEVLRPAPQGLSIPSWVELPGVSLFLRTVILHPYRYGIALLTGIYMFTCFACIFLNVLDRRARTRTLIERTRLTWLAWLGLFTIVGSILQSTGYYFRLPIGAYPVGCLAQLAFLSFLGQVIQVYRLLDLHEMLSRALIFLSQVLIIGGLYSFLLVLFGDQRSWVNLGITIFLASGVVFALQATVRLRIERGFHRLFFLRRYELMKRLNTLDRELPRLLSQGELLDALLQGLRATPQLSNVAIFLWDEHAREYGRVRASGPEAWPRETRVAASSPLVRELVRRLRPLGDEELERELEWKRSERMDILGALTTLQRLDVQVVIPFTASGVLFGFVALKDESLHEGFTQDELDLLQQIADKATVIIQNSESIQRLKERDRLAALGQMAAGLAHEIRNPLGAIRGAAEYLLSSGEDLADREFLDIIMEETDRLNRVVSDFLDYSKPLKVTLEPCDLNRLASQVLQLVRAEGLPGNIEAELVLSPELPAIPADIEKLKQVLLNLLRNAIQAMPTGGQLIVRTRSSELLSELAEPVDPTVPAWVQLEVVDTGSGMTQTQLDNLFIPFYTTKAGGTGLGLAMSQRIVAALGGELEASSVVGQGSTFVLRLPLPFVTPREVELPTPRPVEQQRRLVPA